MFLAVISIFCFEALKHSFLSTDTLICKHKKYRRVFFILLIYFSKNRLKHRKKSFQGSVDTKILRQGLIFTPLGEG